MANAKPVKQQAATKMHLASKKVSPARQTRSQVHDKRTVSVAGIFKQRRKTVTSKGSPIRHGSSSLKKRKAVAFARHDRRSSSISPIKAKNAVLARSTTHPLAQSFNGTSASHLKDDFRIDEKLEATSAYRTHLYNKAVSDLNTTHSSLVTALHESILHPVPDLADPDESSIRLSLIEQLQKETENLYIPLGRTQLYFTEHDADGNPEQRVVELADHIAKYEEEMRKKEQEFAELHYMWEITVGEIFKLGVHAVGEDRMRELLIPAQAPVSPAPEGKAIIFEDGNDLLVADTGDVEPSKTEAGGKGKKRVSFREPLPKILTGPSNFKTAVSSVPEMPMAEVQRLERELEAFGEKKIEEMRVLNKEEHRWWQKKQQRIADAFQEE